jgi:Flp pilus assembly protein TadG
MALILPLIVTIVLGAVDFGRFAFLHIALTNGARVGAGFASIHPVTSITKADWDQEIKTLVAAEMSTTVDDPDLTVTTPLPVDEGNGFKRVEVSVSYPFQMWVNWPMLPNNVTMGRSVVMRFLR